MKLEIGFEKSEIKMQKSKENKYQRIIWVFEKN